MSSLSLNNEVAPCQVDPAGIRDVIGCVRIGNAKARHHAHERHSYSMQGAKQLLVPVDEIAAAFWEQTEYGEAIREQLDDKPFAK